MCLCPSVPGRAAPSSQDSKGPALHEKSLSGGGNGRTCMQGLVIPLPWLREKAQDCSHRRQPGKTRKILWVPWHRVDENWSRAVLLSHISPVPSRPRAEHTAGDCSSTKRALFTEPAGTQPHFLQKLSSDFQARSQGNHSFSLLQNSPHHHQERARAQHL